MPAIRGANAAIEHAVERFQKVKELYLSALDLASECDTPAERKCLMQEMRAVIDEAKSVALEYRNLITRSQETSASTKCRTEYPASEDI